uniref:hydrolase n=1 Tax=Marinobacterium profundum TaxID=1714300 RepID=UPI000837246A
MTPNPAHSPWIDWLDSQHDSMLARTLELAAINSGSLNSVGVNRVRETLQHYCSPLSGTIEVLPVAPYRRITDQGEEQLLPLGDALRIRKRPEAPLQIFFCGHMDTVFAADHPFQSVRWLDDNTLNGPGVADLKGGLMVMLKAIEALERSPYSDHIGWEILFNPDEEIGSPGSAPLISEAALRCDLGLIYEPCMPDGNLAGERKGSGNFSVTVQGLAAHAGREHHLGRNAVRALCDFVSALDDLNGQREGITVNPGFVHGGGAVNVVPDQAMARFNIRIGQAEDEAWCLEQLARLCAEINARDGLSLQLHGGFGRKPKQLTDANQALFELARSCGEQLGLALDWKPTGGCCDGNNLAAAGVPNIDTLGVQGGKIHSSEEFMYVSSFTERAKLSALILLQLAEV